MIRQVVRVLVMGLVLPVVLIAAGPAVPGNAATSYGPTGSVTLVAFPDSLTSDGQSITCAWSGRWSSTLTTSVVNTIPYKATCNTGFNVESASVQFTAEGSGCTLTGPMHEEVDGAGTVSGTMTVDVGTGAGCPIDTICMWVGSEHHTDPLDEEDQYTTTVCALVAGMGAPPGVAGEECPYGTPAQLLETSETLGTANGSGTKARISHRNAAVAPGDVSSGAAQWGFYTVHQPWSNAVIGTAGQYDPQGGLTSPLVGAIGRSDGNFAGPLPIAQDLKVMTAIVGTSNTTPTPVIGYGVFRYYTGSDPLRPLPFSQSATSTSGPQYEGGWGNPSNVAAQLVGKNIPGQCIFYWGTKLYDDPATDYDEPKGPITPEVPEDPEIPDPEVPPGGSGPCDFAFTDPGTWMGGGICLLVKLMGKALGLLGSILGVLGTIATSLLNLASDIVDLLKTALETLFLPDPDLFSDAADDISQDLDDTSLGGYVDLAQGLDGSGAATSASSYLSWTAPGGGATLTGSSGGCAGPTITWEMYQGGTIRPLSTCSGILADIAPKFRLFMMAIICMAAVFRGLGLITTALGVEKSGQQFTPMSASEMYGDFSKGAKA